MPLEQVSSSREGITVSRAWMYLTCWSKSSSGAEASTSAGLVLLLFRMDIIDEWNRRALSVE